MLRGRQAWYGSKIRSKLRRTRRRPLLPLAPLPLLVPLPLLLPPAIPLEACLPGGPAPGDRLKTGRR